MKRLVFFVPIFAFAAAALPTYAAAPPSGIAAFDEAFAKVNDYTLTLRAHEVKGDRMQDRVYKYWFKKPNTAKTLIISGDGAGSGGTWRGGDTVSGHQGGALSFIHLNVSIHDGRATSLRGYTIPDGLLQNQVDRYRTIKGELSEHPGPEIDGVATDEIDLKLADPAQYEGITRMVMYLNRSTHFPVRQVRYQAATSVVDETFQDIKTNVGLKDSDF